MSVKTRKTKVEKLYESLAEDIVSGRLPVGESLPTEMELANELNFGRNTVSQAITRLVQEGLVERRRRAGTRVVSDRPRGQGPSMALDAYAFIYASDRHEAIGRTVNGFLGAAHREGRRVVTLTMGTDYQKEIELVSRLAEFDVKAAAIYPIIPSMSTQMRFSQLLIEAKVPVVLAEMSLPGLRCPSVMVDSFHAGYTVTRYLLEKGLSKIGFLGNQSWAAPAADRYRGFLWAMEEGGKEVLPENVLLEPSMNPDFEDPLREPAALGDRLLEQSSQLEAVVCTNDYIARGMIRAAEGRGLPVPEDLKVVGIDDLNTLTGFEIGLTAYHVPFEDIGKRAFEVLNQVLSGHEPAIIETHVRGAMVPRDSA